MIQRRRGGSEAERGYRVEFLVLGPLEAVDGERVVPLGSAKQRLLLAALLAQANSVVSVDRLADVLWGDDPPVDAVAAVQTYISRLRSALEPGRSSGDEATLFRTRAPGYLLHIEPDQTDAGRFERALAAGQQLLATGEAQGAVAQLDAALALWRGDAYAEFAEFDFARTESLRLEELRRVAIDERVEAKLSLGRHAELVGELEGIVAADPLRERPRRQLMLALSHSGREAEALRAYQAYREHLGAELGVEPSNEMQCLERDIIDRNPNVAWIPDASPVTTPPSAAPVHEAASADTENALPAKTLPTGELTFMFTDLEGSTRLWEEHPEAMKAALARHDDILRDVIATHRGHIVKMTGDGLLAVFEAAPDAVSAGAGALRALAGEAWGPTGPLLVRMAIHTGAAEQRNGDYFGPVPNRTSRLMDSAHGGQFVLSEASATLVRPTLPGDLTLLDLGEHRLSGLAHPERVFQLAIDGLPSRFPPLQSLDAFPVAIRPPGGPQFAQHVSGFAGREPQLEQLGDAWQRAREGELRVALIGGEPGIGKTRLAAELARRAHAEGGIVFYGRCDEEATVPYQPFVEALRDYVAACPWSALHERLHGLEADLARAFPELQGRLAAVATPSAGDLETERYRFFEAITRLLNGITATQPAMLVLDDIHWADKPTLMLFRHVMRSAQNAAMLIVACHRDVDLPRDAPVGDLLVDLRRELFATRVTLTGLSEEESAEFLERTAARQVSRPLIAALHRETNGNPFFLEEMLRHLMETHSAALDDAGAPDVDVNALDLPESVREVLERRLRRLPPTVNDVLTLAAAIGSEFDIGLLERASGIPAVDLLDSLDQAMSARLVQEYPGRVGRYTFAHALVRQTLYAAVRSAPRAQLHARIAQAIEASEDDHGSAAALAQHFRQAMPLVGAGKAIEYATRAGHDAVDDLAFEDAVAYFEQALGLLDEHSPANSEQRVELLIDLAEVLVFVDETAGVNAASRAVDEARAHGSPEQFGRAVVVFAEPFAAVLSYPGRVAALLDEAQRVLGDEHGSLRVRLMAIEAFKYSAYQLQGRDGRALADRAVTLARDAADPATLTAALFARAISLESTVESTERLALGEELVALGKAAGGRAAMATTHGLRVLAGVYLELGDAESLSATIIELRRTGEELRWLPAMVFEAQWRATRALLEGRFDEVRSCWKDMRRYARAYRAVMGFEAQQGYYLAREQGDLADQVGPLEQMAAVSSESLYVPAMLAVARLDTADEAAAFRALESLDADTIRHGANENAWGAVLALLAEVSASSESKAHAALLYERLTPFAGRLLATVIGLACLGAAERYQGMLCATLERWDDAEAHFERALALERRIRGRALLPRTRYWQARFFRQRGAAGDDDAARTILSEVVNDTRELGMRRLCEQAEQLLAR